MVCSCSVHLSSNRSKPGGRKIHFFSFPLKNAERTQQWINAVGRKGFIPTHYSKVCSDHFTDNNFEKKSGGSYVLKLKKNAVPSIFPNYSKITSNAKKQHLSDCSILEECSFSQKVNQKEYKQCSDDENCVLDLSTSVKIPSLSESTLNIPIDDSLAISYRPLLITSSKISCSRPLFQLSPTKCRFSPNKAKLKNKVKLVQQQVRRQKTTIKNLNDLLKTLKDKNLLENESKQLLIEKFDGTTLDIFQNIKNKCRKATGRRFSKQVEKFALTLHYYSPKAYAFARSILILPNSKSLMNWTSSVNAEPGIFSEVMQSLDTLNAEDKHCNLCLNAMSLRKQIMWSDKYNKYVGYCDFGRELNLEETDIPAREALFFMLVSLNSKWKLPIGYVLQNKITAVTQAELVKNILNFGSHSSGLTIWGITCDGAYTNTSMMKILGCNIGNSYSGIKC